MYSNGHVPYKSQTTGSYTILWTHKNTAHQWVALLLQLGVVLPRYGGLNYARGINEVLKRKNVTLHNFVQCSCENTEQKCFIYHQLYHGV